MNRDIQSIIRKHEQIIRQLKQLLESENMATRSREFYCDANKILEVVNNAFNCNAVEKTRKHPVVFARHFLCYCLYEYTRMSLTQIAYYIGLADHSSVINSIKQANNLIATDHYYSRIIADIKYVLKENSSN